MPKAGTPRSKVGYYRPAGGFKRAARIVTRRHSARRRIQIARRSRSVVPPPKPFFVAVSHALLKPGSSGSLGAAEASNAGVNAMQPPTTSEQTISTNAQGDRQSGGNENRATSTSEESGDAGSLPDASPEFRAEMGGLMAYYAARIAAARLTLPKNAVAAIVQSIMNEQTAAVRALTERWQAASEKQRAEKPERPKGPPSKSDGLPKL